jgi:hypothetical protein
LTGFVDADCGHDVSPGVERLEDVRSGDAADIVFCGATTEEENDVNTVGPRVVHG